MRICSSILMPAVLITLLGPTVPALADEAHSICVTGSPLHFPSEASNPSDAAVINSVCGNSLLSQCCSQSGGRWDLECVQEAAWVAKDQNLGDICARDIWAKGVISASPQRFPRDFNLFTLGNVNGLRDAEGPVAAQGNIALNGFRLNWAQKQPVALVALGNLTLANGQIAGRAHYGNAYSATSTVTYLGATAPSAPSQPILFSDAAGQLLQMSQVLSSYTAITANKQYSTVTFTGTDPEMNVFAVDASQLNGTYSYVIDVPQSSSVIINVTGSSPVLQSAGFERRNGLGAERILWNFPNATKLKLSSLTLPGSVLAPLADAAMSSGSLLGTVVVKSAVGIDSFSLRGATFEMPYVCSKPDFDPTIWNDPNNLEHNNCYNYATNVFRNEYGEPGRASGEFCGSLTASCSTAANIARYATNDGLLPTTASATCPKNMTKVALFFQAFMNFGYHWWRQDADNTWSAKNASQPAAKIPFTPEEVTGESKLVGYFCTCSSRIQGHGRAVIE